MTSAQTRFPRYHISTRLAVKIAASLVAGKRRSFKEDAHTAAAGIEHLQVRGEIPTSDSFENGCLVTVNHYHRAGFQAYWIAFAISAVFPYDLQWGMTSAYTYPDPMRTLLVTPRFSVLLNRIASIYGFTAMPPMPPRSADLTERSLAVRDLVRYARSTTRPMIGFAPEGMDMPGGVLASLPPGAGRLAAYLCSLGMAVQPVGVYEEDGCLVLSFGEPYRLPGMDLASPQEVDAAAARRLTEEIAKCLPERLSPPREISTNAGG
ncbi:MAG TPA: hypothetical protein VF813_03915 [Anaerolineaceae bacterium]